MSVLVYPRDYSITHARSQIRQGAVHAMNPHAPGNAACDRMLPLVSNEAYSLEGARTVGFTICRRRPCHVIITGESVAAPPAVKVLAYSVDASWSDSGRGGKKLHAAADPTNEHSSAACSHMIPLNVDMGGDDPSEIRREQLCQKPACQRLFFPETYTPRNKTERRQYPPGLMAAATADRITADRRTARRRRRDEADLEAQRQKESRDHKGFVHAIESWATSDVLDLFLDPETSARKKLALRMEIDARIPPRRT